MGMKSDMSEAELQTMCNKFLRLNGIMFHHIEKGRTVSKKHSAGTPDLIVWFPKGKTIFFELKTADGKMSKEQIDIKGDILRLGFEHYIIRPETFEAFCVIVSKNV